MPSCPHPLLDCHIPARSPQTLVGLVAGLAAALALSGCGGAPRHALVVGGVENAAKRGSPLASMRFARRAGFRVIVLSSVWSAPLSAPGEREIDRLRSAVEAADGVGIEPIVAVYSFSKDTPLTPGARVEFASYAATILRALPQLCCISIGNEPNSGVFWMPQFGGDGSDVAAVAYYRLLSETYDLLKKTNPGVSVIGGSLAARRARVPASPALPALG